MYPYVGNHYIKEKCFYFLRFTNFVWYNNIWLMLMTVWNYKWSNSFKKISGIEQKN